MKPSNQNIICATFSALLFAGGFLFLWLCCPQYLTYQEQYQLFLFGSDYFTERMGMPGGLADYISEFVVQFCYIPVYGAALISLLVTLQQILLGTALTKGHESPLPLYSLCALPGVMMLGAFGDENTLLSYAAALTLTSAAILLSTLIRRDIAAVVTATLCFLPLYWCVGPVALLYPLAVALRRRTWIPGIVSVVVCVGLVFAAHRLWCVQYPLEEMYLGINYYRIPFIHPTVWYAVFATVAVLAALSSSRHSLPSAVGYALACAVALFAAVYVPSRFDSAKSSILEYDMLVRQARWADIIAKAEKERPADNFSLQAVNLALAMTGSLTDRMFEFDQHGTESLMSPAHLDNTSMLITSEVLFQLPLTNAALSTTFYLQESIMNDRKSGRFMKRLAECMIINGRYEVARKYIDMLSKSLFYSDWADNARRLLGNDSAVESHPVYGPKRRMAFSRNAFYFMPEIEKILTILAVDSRGANRVAWEYSNAAYMLKGDLPGLAALSANAGAFGPANSRHTQEALAMLWTMNHPDFNGVPFDISPEVKSSIASLSAAMMRNPSNPAAWRRLAENTYWAYFIDRQQRRAEEAPAESHQTATQE